MSEREPILKRIREALSLAAPLAGGCDSPRAPLEYPGAHTGSARQWLPPVGATFEEQLALFRANSAELRTDFQCFQDSTKVNGHLMELRDREGWRWAASHGGELAQRACQALGLPVLRTDAPYEATDLEQCDVGISECDALIAQTGSVLVTSKSAGGRALSVLPPHHVVLARREQMLPDLTAGFEWVQRKYQPNLPSFISLITGPSRTGDIERILVLGAHGPKKLTVILC